MTQKQLDLAYKCGECHEYFPTLSLFGSHYENSHFHRNTYFRPNITVQFYLCTYCMKEISDSIEIEADGGALISLRLYKNCKNYNFPNH